MVSSALSFIFNLIIFLLSLCVLICLHELGHLSMAKLFKVYCYEYSIGMGPLIYQHQGINKKTGKKRETKISIRALPVGGYVSMAGDEDAEGDLTNDEIDAVPKERTLGGIHWCKQIVVMIAGIVVNFIIGFLFFIISYTCCPQYIYSSNKVVILENSKLISENINQGDKIQINSIHQFITKSDGTIIEIYDPSEGADKSVSTFKTNSYTEISTVLNYATFNSDTVSFLPMSEKDVKTIEFEITLQDGTETTKIVNVNPVEYENKNNIGKSYTWDTIGFSVTTDFLGFAEGMKQACSKFGQSVCLLFEAIGSLFVSSDAWAQTGGIISVFRVSSQAVSLGAGVFFSYWGLISVNLAIFNLLPFPGLDGWHIVVAAFEGISKKKIPNKVKSIVSFIGMILLFGLMIVLLVKDLFF